MRGRAGGLPEIQRLVEEDYPERPTIEFSGKVWRMIEEDDYTQEDLKECVRTGRVHKRERDRYREAVDGNVYTIIGRDTRGRLFYTVGKIMSDDEGRYYFFITAHEAG
jgi:hypothetical protein